MESDKTLVIVPCAVRVQQVRVVGGVTTPGYGSTDTHREDVAKIDFSAKLDGAGALRPWYSGTTASHEE